jgi:hypothetical protein
MVTYWTGMPSGLTLDDAFEWISGRDDRLGVPLTDLALTVGDSAVGALQALPRDPSWPAWEQVQARFGFADLAVWEVGFWLLPEGRGRGVVQAGIRHVALCAGPETVIAATTRPANTHAVRSLMLAGMAQVGSGSVGTLAPAGRAGTLSDSECLQVWALMPSGPGLDVG